MTKTMSPSNFTEIESKTTKFQSKKRKVIFFFENLSFDETNETILKVKPFLDLLEFPFRKFFDHFDSPNFDEDDVPVKFHR